MEIIKDKVSILFLLLVSLWMMIGCSTSSCSEGTTVIARINFYDATTRKARTADKITVVGLTEQGRLDSILYKESSGLKYIKLPLRVNAQTTTYEIKIEQKGAAIIDTLTISHTNYPYFITPDCDCMVYHSILNSELTKHGIVEITLINSEITNQENENLALYF